MQNSVLIQGYGKELIFARIVQMDRILISKISDMGSSPTRVLIFAVLLNRQRGQFAKLLGRKR